jgi:AAA domain
MPDRSDHYSNLLRFWRAIETFTLPDVPDYKIKHRKGEDNPHVLREDKALPWAPGQMRPAKEGKRWKYTLFFFIVLRESVVEWLARLGQSTDDYREKAGGETCLSALVLDEFGRPTPRGYAPAAFIHAIRLLRESRNQEELTDLLRYAQDDYAIRFGASASTDGPTSTTAAATEELLPLTWPTLQKELTYLKRLAGALIPTHPVICIPTEVSSTATPEAPFLNSPYLQQLDRLILHPQEIGRPLETLLTPQIDIKARINVLHPRTLLESINPRKQSPGRWPADPAHGLYSAQQAALHLALPALRQDGGLPGINGPPGTGKTTLLREIITDVVVTRARRLLEAGVDDLFSVRWTPVSSKAGFYDLNKDVFGDQGIVVSGNNNAAIEHITKELPLLRSIDSQAFPEAGYFSGAATTIMEESSWAMLSAALGRFEKKSAFVNKFWFTPGQSFGAGLREQQTIDNRDEYAKTAAALKALLKEYEAYQALASAYHERLLAGHVEEGLAQKLITDYSLAPTSIPTLAFLQDSSQTLHALTPYTGRKLHLLRSHIFLRSLELHEWAIRCNARNFRNNLGAFIDMLSGKYRDEINERMAATLWNSFFFCIPVVSVTLASFARQFPKMGAASLGWLLLDEAGQATLPSVCGPLWRAKRAIIIGDTLQIPPVVTIPRALSNILRKSYGIVDDCWSPVDHSAQFLADRATMTGTTITRLNEVWTGIPLRAHRRCGEPMFSISNAIAYNGQMVRVGAEPPADAPTTTDPASGWIDVIGDGEAGTHLIPAEVEIVGDLLKELKTYSGSIFVISPFKSIAETCANRYNDKERGVECGTIHTFQGKEADIVLLILGTTAADKRARDWVAATPNMLNVAVTRARHRLYVIGNRTAWSKHRYFDQLARMLPIKEHLTGRLF